MGEGVALLLVLVVLPVANLLTNRLADRWYLVTAPVTAALLLVLYALAGAPWADAGLAPTAWARGINARVQALASNGAVAEGLYRDSIAQLSTTNLCVDLARGHLLYGEWLRREGRRGDARKQLHTAHQMFVAMDVSAFAERARRELLATGEKIRKRAAAAAGLLTAQEAQIARLVQQGLSNPEIATRLFLSDRTVEWHLRNVFGKVGVSSRRQLRDIDLDVRVMEPTS